MTATRHDDRGITIPLMALLLTALMISTAFALDLGRLRVERRNMQADADVIALDMLRLADGRTTFQIQTDDADLNTIADHDEQLAESAAANDIAVSALTVTYGLWDSSAGTFTPTGALEVPNAVQVLAETDVKYFFATAVPGVDQSGSTQREAIASKEDITALTAGSYLVGMQAGNSALLNNLLATHVCPGPTPSDPPTCGFGVTAGGYQGLANANVTFDDLAFAGGFGTPNEFLEANLTQEQVATVTATALNNQGDAAGAAIFTDIANEAASQPSPSSQPVCDPNDSTQCVAEVEGSNNEACLDNDTSTDCAAAQVGVNPFNLFMAFAQMSNGNNFLDMSAAANPSVIPGVTINSAQTSYQVIEPAHQAIGPVGTTASSTQLRVRQAVNVTPTPIAVGPVTVTGSMTVNYELEGGKLLSTVTAQTCNPNALLNTADFSTIARPLEGSIGQGTTPVGTLVVTTPLGSGTVTVRIDKTIPASTQTVTPMPIMSIGETRSAVGTTATLGLFVTASDVDVTVTAPIPGLSVTEAALEAALVPVINTVLTEANTAAQPALSNLGMAISSGDVTHDDTTCGNPLLVK